MTDNSAKLPALGNSSFIYIYVYILYTYMCTDVHVHPWMVFPIIARK